MSRATAECEVSRPASLSPADLRSLRTLHDGLTGGFGAALSALLRSPVEASLTGVDQLTYGNFVSGLASPSYFNVLKAESLGDCLMLDIELSILYPMLDRMLGGGHENESLPRRPPSDIELPLAARVVRLFIEELCLAWQSVHPLTIDVTQVESHPRLMRILPSDEMVAIVGFRLTIGDRQGMMRLCLPCQAIRRIGDDLAGARRPKRSKSEVATPNVANARSTLVIVDVTLATTPIATSDLGSLRVGDILVTETNADSAATVSIEGKPKFRAKPGACRGHKAICITEAIENPKTASD